MFTSEIKAALAAPSELEQAGTLMVFPHSVQSRRLGIAIARPFVLIAPDVYFYPPDTGGGVCV